MSRWTPGLAAGLLMTHSHTARLAPLAAGLQQGTDLCSEQRGVCVPVYGTACVCVRMWQPLCMSVRVCACAILLCSLSHLGPLPGMCSQDDPSEQ